MNKITIIVKNIGQNPKITRIPANTTESLEALKKIVGGYIETTDFKENILIICNEEGKLQNLSPNFFNGTDIIVGNAAFIGKDGENFISLTDPQIKMILHKFSSIYRNS